MRRIITSLFIMFIFYNVNSQQRAYQKPEYDRIKSEILDRNSGVPF